MARQDPNRDELLAKLNGRRVIASVSGGKDSAALSLWLTEMGIDHIRCFQDTGWESDILYRYLRGPLTEKIGPITEIRSKKYPGGMVDLVRGRGMFPSRLLRMCTQELKVFPARDFIAAQQDAHGEVVNAVGIRGEESESRSKMPEWEWNDTFDCEVWRPLINWTEQDVIDIHQRHGLSPCPLYLGVKGADGGVYTAQRVGCYPCIFARKGEVRMVAETDPARIDLIRSLETELTERAGAMRAMFHSRVERVGIRPIDSVVAWAHTENRKADLEPFEDPDRGCMRWGMCETHAHDGDSCSIGARVTTNGGGMRYVKHIESNVKRGCNVDLGPRTLIVGPNGAGKSTIVNAIELALTGRASDVAGRVTLASGTELAAMIRTGDVAGFATATLDDGTVAGWTLTPGSKAVRGGPDLGEVFPLRAVRENLTGSVETARKWLLGRVAGTTAWETVLASIPTALRDRVTTLASANVLGLPVALETARSAARDATKQAATLTASADAAEGSLPPPATPEAVAAAKAQAATSIDAQIRQVEETVKGAVARRDAAKPVMEAAREALAKLPVGSTAVAEAGAAMVKVLDAQIATKATKCAICAGDTNATTAVARRLQITQAISAASHAVATRASAETAARQAEAAYNAALEDVRRLTGELQRLHALRDAIPEPNLDAERTGRLAEVQRQRDAALAATRTSAEWAEAATAIETAIAKTVDAARAAFEAKVTGFMPAGIAFALQFTDSTARFGIREGTGVRSALSGAEWAIVTAALAAAVAPADGMSVIVPEDRPVDPAMLTGMLRGFQGAPGQVIIATPIMPTEVPEGWTVIAVGGEVAKSATAPTVTTQGAVAAPEPVKRGRGRPRKAKPGETIAPPPGSATVPAEKTNGAAGGEQGALSSLFEDPPPTEFEPAAATNPCPGCGVDLNVPGILHSNTCSAIGTATSLDDLM